MEKYEESKFFIIKFCDAGIMVIEILDIDWNAWGTLGGAHDINNTF